MSIENYQTPHACNMYTFVTLLEKMETCKPGDIWPSHFFFFFLLISSIEMASMIFAREVTCYIVNSIS